MDAATQVSDTGKIDLYRQCVTKFNSSCSSITFHYPWETCGKHTLAKLLLLLQMTHEFPPAMKTRK